MCYVVCTCIYVHCIASKATQCSAKCESNLCVSSGLDCCWCRKLDYGPIQTCSCCPKVRDRRNGGPSWPRARRGRGENKKLRLACFAFRSFEYAGMGCRTVSSLERSNVSRALFPGTFDLGARAQVGWRFLRAQMAVTNGNPLGDASFPARAIRPCYCRVYWSSTYCSKLISRWPQTFTTSAIVRRRAEIRFEARSVVKMMTGEK